MRYHNITKDDMLNGDGLRVVLWVAGCGHHCKGCQNPITWDPNGGLEFDEEAKMYAWAPLGCGNYAPNFFGTSVPEVVEVRENPDGTVTLTVNAVCDMVICDDALITHDLTVKFKEDESFQYLGNEIRKEDRNNVPEYQYRVKGEIKNGS